MEVFNSRREIYLSIMDNLFRLQKTYNQASSHLNARLEGFVPRSEDELEEWDSMNDQIEACKSAIDKLEMVKDAFSLGFLTEGALIAVDDLFKSIVVLEKFLDAIEEEKLALLSTEPVYTDFLNLKSNHLLEVKAILEKLLEYKLERRHDFNVLEKH